MPNRTEYLAIVAPNLTNLVNRLSENINELAGPWEMFRARVKSAPEILDNPVDFSDAILQNVWQDGIRLVNSFELVIKRRNGNNQDLPDTLPLDEMGIPGPSDRENYIWPEVDPVARPYRKSRHLDAESTIFRANPDAASGGQLVTRTVGGMNDRDFRDRCVQANGKLYVLYPMGLPEVSPANHLRAETVEKWLESPCRCKRACEHIESNIESNDADSIVKVLSNLQMDRASTTRMMFGYMASDGEHREGIKSMDEDEIMDLAYYLEDLEAQLPKLLPIGENEPVALDDHRAFYLDHTYNLIEWGLSTAAGPGLGYDISTPGGQIRYIEDMAKKAMAEKEQPNQSDLDWLISKGFAVEDKPDEESENQAYEDSEFKSVGDGWTAHPLHYGEDTVKYHWCACIKTAGVKRLYAWKRLMGKLWWLTYRQRSDVWNRIWERQASLVEMFSSKIDNTIEQIVEEMESLNENQAKALIYSYQVGGSFDAFTSFDFEEKGDEDLVFWLWDYYRKTFK